MSRKHNLAKYQMSLLLQNTGPSCSRVQSKESSSQVLFLKLLAFQSFPQASSLPNSQIQDRKSHNMIGGIFQFKSTTI